MTEEKNTNRLPHQIILDNRKNLSVSGVENIESFDDNTIILITSMGELTIRGTELHITKSNVETGELIMDGSITDLIYTERVPKKETSGKLFWLLFGA